MSNTSTITPYDNQSAEIQSNSTAGTASIVCAGAVVGVAGLALAGTALGAYGVYRMGRWLAVGRQPSSEELKEMKAVELEYQEKLDGQQLAGMITLNLNQNDPKMLVNSAKKLNYRIVNTKEHSLKNASAPILLEKDSGDRLAITINSFGRLSIHTAGDQTLLHNLISRHTQDKVQDFLIAKGMQYETARLSNGEIQILAREADAGHVGEAAEIKAQVRSDGTTIVDIEKCRGPRCQDIVDQLANATGCRVTGTTKKGAWFQLPGEPTKIKVKT